jgi:hypothetical protein
MYLNLCVHLHKGTLLRDVFASGFFHLSASQGTNRHAKKRISNITKYWCGYPGRHQAAAKMGLQQQKTCRCPGVTTKEL